jgi:hypothetical protein
LKKTKTVELSSYYSKSRLLTQGRRRPHRVFLPQLDEIYFITAEKTILEKCVGIVPNFINE